MTITIDLPISPIVCILALVFVVDLALAWRIWRGNPRHPVNIYFALAVLMAGLWTLAILAYRTVEPASLISLFLRFTYFFSTLIIFFFYLFTYYFPFKTFKIPRGYLIILLLVVMSLATMTLLPNIFVAADLPLEIRFQPETPLFWRLIFTGYFIGMLSSAFCNLVIKYKKSDGIWRARLKEVIWCYFCFNKAKY